MIGWINSCRCSRPSFSCLYLDHNCLIPSFVLCLAKSSLCFIPCFKLMPTSFLTRKSKWKVFRSVVIASFLSPIYKFVVSHYCNASIKLFLSFWSFYYAHTEYVVFFWSHCSICLNYFMLLLVLKILEVWLIVCFQLRILILFVLLTLFSSSSSSDMGSVSKKLLFINF